jgi:hypothetical protein
MYKTLSGRGLPVDTARLKRCDRQVLDLEEFRDADVAALEGARAPAPSKAFDGELK